MRLGAEVFFQAEDGIRDLVRSRGLGDVYKRQSEQCGLPRSVHRSQRRIVERRTTRQRAGHLPKLTPGAEHRRCLLYTSDAADERSSVDLGGRRIIKKKNRRRLEPRTDTAERTNTGRSTQSQR